MIDGRLLRFLDLVRRELGSDDARIEIGGQQPDPAHAMWTVLPNGWRVVALFASPPPDRPELEEKLAALIETFSDVLAAEHEQNAPRPPPSSVETRLRDELESLAIRARALEAAVIDNQTPTIWGSSFDHATRENLDWAREAARCARTAKDLGLDVAALLSLEPSAAAAELADHEQQDAIGRLLVDLGTLKNVASTRGTEQWHRCLLLARALIRVRDEARESPHLSEHGDLAVLARRFAGVYWLVLAFDGPFSQLHSEAALLHHLPVIERLVLALPPVDPPPAKARVIRLPRRG